jgi:hypothetical protein
MELNKRYYAGSCEHGNDPSGSLIRDENFEKLTEYLLSTKDCVPSRYIDNQSATSASQKVNKLITNLLYLQ